MVTSYLEIKWHCRRSIHVTELLSIRIP